MEAIIESVDEFYSENLAQQVVRGMREAASRGFWVAPQAPYGYRKVHVQDGVKKRPILELDPPADAVIRRVFQMMLRSGSVLDITKTLNDEGIPSPDGKRWAKTTIHRMLCNEAYTGTVVWGWSPRTTLPSPRGERLPRHRLSAGVPTRGQEDALAGAHGHSSPSHCESLPPQRAPHLRELRQGSHRIRGQGRQVHLLRLPVTPQAWQALLQGTQAQRQAL